MSHFKKVPQMGMAAVLRQGPGFRRHREGPCGEEQRFQKTFRQRGTPAQGKERHEEMMDHTQK